MATFVLVQGAWHGGWCWRRVTERLRAQGHTIFTPTLTGLGELVGISGSLVVGLALAKGRLDIEQAYTVCHVDEDHQRELWGEDFEATQRRENVCADLAAAYRFLKLVQVQ